MNPVRKACLTEAAKIWQDQPSLGMLETVNEVRVALRGYREWTSKDLPGIDAIRNWLTDAIAAGELSGPNEGPRRSKGKK